MLLGPVLKDCFSEEPGEIDSSPDKPFPRAIHEGLLGGSSSSFNKQLARSSDRSRHRLSDGPIPQQGTPQDRFRQAMLGMSRNNRNASRPSSGRRPGPDFSAGSGPLAIMPPPGAINPLRRPQPHGAFRPSPMQVLSEECQRRGFNPVWDEMITPDGSYICHVTLRDRKIKTRRLYDDALSAKMAVAQKALVELWTWGVHAADARRVKQEYEVSNGQGPASRGNHSAPFVVNREGKDIVMNDDAAINSDRRGRGRDGRATEPASLSEQMRSAVGISLPEHLGDNPDVARAFLEGLAAGARLVGPKSRGKRSRSRSPSPRSRTSDRYRERSRGQSSGASSAGGHGSMRHCYVHNVTGDHYDESGRRCRLHNGDRYGAPRHCHVHNVSGVHHDETGRRCQLHKGDYHDGPGRHRVFLTENH